jgi:hypothetical protein
MTYLTFLRNAPAVPSLQALGGNESLPINRLLFIGCNDHANPVEAKESI